MSFTYREKTVIDPSLSLYGKTVEITGTVENYPETKENSILLELRDCVINGYETKLRINLYCKENRNISIGDQIKASGAYVFSIPEQNEFYYHTLSTGKWLGAYSNAPELIKKYGGGSAGIRLKQFKHIINEKLINKLGTNNGSIAITLLTGDRSLMSPSFTNKLKTAGASHMFAVSGMHLSIWASVLFFILRKKSKVRIIPNIAAIVFTVFYMIVTGLSPSVIRAGIMLITVFAGKMIRKQHDPLNSLGLSVCAMLSVNIFLAGNVSFLLSTFATAGIISLYPVFFKSAQRDRSKARALLVNSRNGIFLSLSAMLFTVPVSGIFFGWISLLAPVSSLLCAASVSGVIISSFLAICTRIGFIYKICGFFCETITVIIDKLSQYDFFLFHVDLKRISVYYISTAAVLLLVYILSKKDRAKRVILALLSCCILILGTEITIGRLTYHDINIYVPACGNATNICVSSFNESYNVMIGTGEDFDDYAIMNGYLKDKGIADINTLIIPRQSQPENGMFNTYLEYAPENIYNKERFELTLKNGMTYKNYDSAYCSAGLLYNDKLKIVFSFYPGGDFENEANELQSADYLFCRGDIPAGINTAGYDKIIVLTDKTSSQLSLPENASTTAETGGIIIETDGR